MESSISSIAIKYEGGIGDVLLFNRFVPAILSKYPNAKLHAFLDSEGNTMQEKVLRHLFGHLYSSITTIKKKKYEKFIISSQWGDENQIGFIENVPDDVMDTMGQYDLLIDGHIDSLKWLDEDFDWLSSFRTFPPARNRGVPNDGKDYIITHLISTTSTEHRMESWYIESLVKELHNLCKEKDLDLYVISTPEVNELYGSNIKDLPGVFIINEPVETVCDLILNAKAMVSTDSGFRVIAYSADIPVVSFSKQCSQPGQIAPSHIVRWNPFPETTFPIHWASNEVTTLIKRCLDHRIYRLFPNLKDWEKELIKREYIVNEEKSIL
tara:strand:- start:2725 stop:3696 length:972 start_codon:yes stop_codon:yes gene_type:complete